MPAFSHNTVLSLKDGGVVSSVFESTLNTDYIQLTEGQIHTRVIFQSDDAVLLAVA